MISECHCGGHLINNEIISVLTCEKCGMEFMLEPEINDRPVKKNNYIASRHGASNISGILKLRPPKIPADELTEVICKIRVWLSERPFIKNPTCEVIRTCLSNIKCTTLNSNIPYLCNIINPRNSIPDMSTEEIQIINDKMTLARKILRTFKSTGSNIHVPYTMHRIIDMEYDHDPVKKRKLLANIHMQSPNTLKKHEKTWEKICALSNGELRFRNLDI
jgi:DNA-directed RNA polymerase subunit M/transcription elongation factor TFIIS